MTRLYVLVLMSACFVVLFAQSQAYAVNPATWSISESTTGGDVLWTSPTAVDLGLPRYYTSFEVTRVEVFTALGGTDVTNQLEATTGGGIFDSLPVTLLDEALNEPTTGTSATVLVEVDAGGFGQFSFTDVTLGTIFILPITQIDVDTTVAVQGLVPGDFDADFVVDATDLSIWEAAFGLNAGADTDFDGDSDGSDFLDWQSFSGSDYSSLPAAVIVPEPASAALWLMALIVMLRTRTVNNRSA